MEKEIYEIERKFLVRAVPENIDEYQHFSIRQGYISTDPTIRLRQRDDEYILTVKSAGIMKKIEYELPLRQDQFEKLWKKVEGNTVEKTRYVIPLENGLKAELDIYKGFLEGFMNVEVEFASVRDALLFDPPQWFGEDVTQNPAYSNSSLAKYGIPEDN